MTENRPRRCAGHTPLRLFIGMALAASMASAPAVQAADTATQQLAQRQYDISAGPLDRSLQEFARQSAVTLSADATLTAGKSSPGVQGQYTVDTGFAVLLAQTGLRARLESDGSYTIQRAAAAPVNTMSKVRVSADEIETAGVIVPPSRTRLGPLGDRPLLDTPFSITALPREVIEDQQARSLIDLTKNDASIVADKSFTYAELFVRGFWLSTISGNYRKDGLPIISITNNLGLEAVEQVEVLKGLSGFLYGFASPGGAVNYVFKRPTAEPLAKFTLGFSSDNLLYGAADASVRFGPDGNMGLRVNAASEDGDRPVDRAELSRYMGSIAYDWQIGDDTLLSLDYYRQRNRDRAENGRMMLPASVPVPDAPDAGRLYGQPWPEYAATDENFGVRLAHRFNDAFSTTLAWNRYENEFEYEVMFNTLDAAGNYSAQFQRDPDRGWQADSVQALATVEFSTGAIEHRVTTGVDYMQAVGHVTNLGGYAVVVGTSSLANPVYFTQPAPPVSINAAYDFTKRSQTDLLLSDELSFGEHWQLIAGLRRSNLKVSNNPTLTGSNTRLVYDKGATTPSVGLIYKPLPLLSLYASYAESLEQGGTAPPGTINAGELMPPLTSKQWEAGAKYSMDERLNLTAAVFRIDKALQFTDNTVNRYVQDGQQVHDGFETAAFGEVLPGVNVIASYTWLDAEARDTGNPALNNKLAPNVPEHQAGLYADYRLPWMSMLSVNGGIYYSDRRAVDNRNTQFIPSWTRYDAGLRFDPEWGSYRPILRLSVRNLADENYWESAPFAALSLAEPRTYRFSVEMSFR